jgi:hypothetical protein
MAAFEVTPEELETFPSHSRSDIHSTDSPFSANRITSLVMRMRVFIFVSVRPLSAAPFISSEVVVLTNAPTPRSTRTLYQRTAPVTKLCWVLTPIALEGTPVVIEQ